MAEIIPFPPRPRPTPSPRPAAGMACWLRELSAQYESPGFTVFERRPRPRGRRCGDEPGDPPDGPCVFCSAVYAARRRPGGRVPASLRGNHAQEVAETLFGAVAFLRLSSVRKWVDESAPEGRLRNALEALESYVAQKIIDAEK